MQPVIPFWVQNLLLGVTDIQLPRFVFGTVAGILPVTAVLANVGAQLNDIESFAISSVFTPQLLLALSLLALTPLLLRLLVNGIRQRMRGS